MTPIYQPAEDSYLLSEILKKEIPRLLKENSNLTFLEIGSGSGMQLEAALKSGLKKQNIFSCDINKKAVEHCNEKDFNCVESDLFSAFKEGVSVRGTLVPLKWDVIIFNPPYLPEDSREPIDSQVATTGGKKGSEIINRFLKEAKNHLHKNGKIFLITSSLTKDIDFKDYKKEVLGKKELFQEQLFALGLFFNK